MIPMPTTLPMPGLSITGGWLKTIQAQLSNPQRLQSLSPAEKGLISEGKIRDVAHGRRRQVDVISMSCDRLGAYPGHGCL